MHTFEVGHRPRLHSNCAHRLLTQKLVTDLGCTHKRLVTGLGCAGAAHVGCTHKRLVTGLGCTGAAHVGCAHKRLVTGPSCTQLSWSQAWAALELRT